MTTYKLKGLLQNTGWISPAYVSVDETGKISSVSDTSLQKPDYDLNCFAIPGFQNAHSHAFQYAMAGLAERHSTSQTPDDFWSWRDAMYKLALSVDPDQMEVIATMLYSEMLRHGYTRVAEFHYVHHDKNGKPYDHLAAMGERLVAAAENAGIGITLIPIFYQKGGFGKDPVEAQKRFISADRESYLKLLEASGDVCKNYAHANVALGIHSMRGVEPEIIKEIALDGPRNLPFHIHVSEQLKEVSDSLAYLGKRPVQWLLDNCALDARFHLVHATHLTEAETKGIALSGAHVVLCPSTEGNLGDGIFPLLEYRNLGGKWSIGTDSHIGLNPLEELRILDYGQRLTSHKRNTFYAASEGDSGKFAIDMITKSGRKAMHNFSENYFAAGDFFNAALIDADAPLIASSGLQNLTATIVYSTDVSMQCGVISHGKLISEKNNPDQSLKIKSDFVACLKKLANRL
ncbi:MAG: formimidoylglutamate deiminase [Bacteroidetes bacterium]|nr:formimidoylglutamate deiminase [Bacteroidota bacterium]